MKPIIKVEGISKEYSIGAARVRHDTLRDQVAHSARSSLRQLRGIAGGRRNRGDNARGDESFWALKDVSFDVVPGEVIGIIGRNGAGKSTLLKVLSRITEPTTGRVELYGRVGSLLEVGTGFHPELTGRENIYLNGAILGMQQVEIRRKFDEIVAFAEIERFLDTPVKRYSSGMYTRLAFSVAAHLEPEILIVDEVLAVGDAQFQKKCLGKMGDVARAGRTVLFVSHNIGAVRMLCNKGIFLSEGEIAHAGAMGDVIAYYEESVEGQSAERLWSDAEAPGSDHVKLLAVRVLNNEGRVSDSLTRSEMINVQLQFRVKSETMRLNPHIHLLNRAGELLFISTNLHDTKDGQRVYDPGIYTAMCVIPDKLLNVGIYFVTVYLVRDLNHHEIKVESAVSFDIAEDGSDRGDYLGGWAGQIRPTLDWRIKTSEF